MPTDATTRATHTPGPWHICGGATPHYMAINSPEGYVVYSMADRKGDVERGEYINAPTYERQSANARLIAAAPDLLAACKALCRRMVNNELVNRPDDPCNRYDQPAYDAAVAAISKAEGM